MNITHIITTIDRGGAENQLIQNLLLQSKKGINVSVLFLKGNSYWKNFLIEKNIKVFGPFFNSFYYFNIFGLISFYKKVNKNKQIIHCHMPPSLLLMNILLPFSKNKKIIYTSHNDEPFFPIKILDIIFSKYIINKANKIVAITNSVKRFLIKRYNINERKVSVIDYSFDPSIYVSKNNSDEFNIYKNGKIYIGIVARLVNQKRVDLLIKLLKKLIKLTKK